MESDENSSRASAAFACQICGGHFQYEIAPLSQNTSEFVECPHCHQETEVQASNASSTTQATEPPPIIPPPVPMPIWFGNEQSTVELCTTSGSQITIAEVLLYDAEDLQALAALKAQADQLFGGAQSQYGFIGDVGWVVGMATLQNWVLNAQSEKMAEAGLKVLEEIRSKEQYLRQTQNYFLVGRIENMEHPYPSLWRAELPDPGRAFIHNGGEFLTIKDVSAKVICLRWSEVIQYNYQLSPS